MKLLIVQASPKMKKGNTERFLSSFMEGVLGKGVEPDVLYLHKMNITPCTSCFRCWAGNRGVCVAGDDTNYLKEMFLKADAFIIASPVYIFSITGYLKLAMDKLFFLLSEPEFYLEDAVFHHPARYPDHRWTALFLIHGAFDGAGLFSPLEAYFSTIGRTMIGNNGKPVIDPVTCMTIGFSELLSIKENRENCKPLFSFLKEAGEEFVRTGRVQERLLAEINRPVYEFLQISRDDAIRMNNERIREITGQINYLSDYFHKKSSGAIKGRTG